MAGINSLLLPEERKEDDAPYVSPVGAAFQEEAEAQEESAVDHIKAGFDITAVSGMLRKASDEKEAAIADIAIKDPENINASDNLKKINTAYTLGLVGFTYDSGDGWDTKEDDIEELLKDIPRSMADEITDEPTLEAAMRARARILEDVSNAQRASMQWEGGALSLTGSLLDVDAPLMLLSGGMFGAAKVASVVSKVTKSKRVIGTVQGASGGLQAGTLVGGLDLLVRETADETTFITSVIGGTTLGSTMGFLSGPVRGAMNDLSLDRARKVEEGDPSLNATGETVSPETPEAGFEVKPVEAAEAVEATPQVREGKTFTPTAEDAPVIRPNETTIKPDAVEGTPTQKKPCMRG